MKPKLFLFFSNIIYLGVSIYLYQQLDTDISVLVLVLVHFFLASVANTVLVKKVLQNNVCLISSPVFSFLIITQIYFTYSSLKYFADINTFNPSFELTRSDQFIGSLIGWLVISVILLSIRRSYFITPSIFTNWVNKHISLILFLSFILLIISIVSKVFLTIYGYGSTYSDSLFTKLELRDRSDAILLNINEVVDIFILIYFFLLFQFYNAKSAYKFTGYLFLFIAILIFLYNLFFFKARLLILLFLIIIIFLIQAFQPQKGLLYLILLFIFLPVTIAILPLLNSILGRDNLVSESLEFLIQITSGRADLTDYAYAVLKKSDFIGLSPDIVLQALLNAIPNVFFPGKDLFTRDAYSIALNKIGWEAKSDTSLEIIDYQDSFFSAGAMSFGIIGFILVPIFFVKLLNLIALFIDRRIIKGYSALLVFPLISIALKIEVEFSNIIINIRNSLQMVLFIFILTKLYSRFR